jgi:16S rRNA U516 pseudouridylate synthase RsuA-like enzyme
MADVSGLSMTAFIIHKPMGVISATVDSAITSLVRKEGDPLCGLPRGGEGRPTVYSLASAAGFPTDFSLVGRLDAETSGVMLFTRDIALDRAVRDPPEELANCINPFKIKEYALTLLCPRLHGDSRSLEELAEEMAAPFSFSRHGQWFHTGRAEVVVTSKWQEPALMLGQAHLGWCLEVRVRLREGKHHQIRRMARRSGFTVLSLTRVRIAGVLSLDSIPTPGQCRWLSPLEVAELRAGLGLG